MAKLKRYLSDLAIITKKTAAAWWKADPFRQSAVVAYYAIFSIPALLVIVIALAGLAFGREAVQGEISSQISSALGQDTAKQVEDIIANASARKNTVPASILGVVTLIVGSTGVFSQLQATLNEIWEVKITETRRWMKVVRDRLFSFGLVISICFLMLISLLISAGLEAFSGWIKRHLPDLVLYLFELLNFLISIGVIGVLFAMIFKILPDAKIRLRDVWIGALVTTLLFTLGKYALSIYFAKATPESTYGAAGSIILIMLWVSYSCMILFFGAQFTKQYALYYEHGIHPR